MVAEPQAVAGQAQIEIPLVAPIAPVLVPGERLAGVAEELDLHLLELAGAEGEIPRRDLIAEALADLGHAEGNAHARAVQHVLEVDEDALGRFGAEKDLAALVAHRARMRFEHQVEFPRLGQVAAAVGARILKPGLIELLRGDVPQQLSRSPAADLGYSRHVLPATRA